MPVILTYCFLCTLISCNTLQQFLCTFFIFFAGTAEWNVGAKGTETIPELVEVQQTDCMKCTCYYTS
jgi:hypothetical protein